MSVKGNQCKIIILGERNDEALDELINLPPELVNVVAIGSSFESLLEDIKDQRQKKSDLLSYDASSDIFSQSPEHLLSEATVIFITIFVKPSVLESLLKNVPRVCWIQSMSAGLDHMLYDDLIANDRITVTKAKNVFNEALAEYVLCMMLYFSKDVARWNHQKMSKVWEKFFVSEIRGKTIGIVGYGDIGSACAKLAKGCGMRVFALRRNPDLSSRDPLVDKLFSSEELLSIVAEVDFLVAVTPLTAETRGMFHKGVFRHCKQGQVFINIGRGKCVVEEDLIAALEHGPLSAAALDVTAIEPLPPSSPLWTLPNVVISPHNADQTRNFRHRSVSAFCENCSRFVEGQELEGIANKSLGY